MKNTRGMFKALLGGILLLGFALVGQAGAQTWTELSPVGGPPAVRILHSAVFNTANNRMIVFGGFNGSGDSGSCPPMCLNDVWVLANADGLGGPSTWTQLSPIGGPPSARGYHSAVYDAVNNRMMVFAGDPNIGFCFGAVNDVWVLTNADGTGGTPTWTQLSPSGGPPELRQGPTAVYDSATNRMVVFGGKSNACLPFSNDVWVLQNANGLGGTPVWTQLAPVGGPPPPRAGHSTVYDSTNNRMILFGGTMDTAVFNDVWVLENANGLGGTPAWTQLSPTDGPPTARSFATAVYDQATNRMVVFGGSTTTGRVNDVWVLENANGLGGTPNWAPLSPTGVPPSPRDMHTAVFNAPTNRMVMFAGRPCVAGCFPLNDVWVLTDANGIVAGTNHPPIANAGPDQTMEATSASGASVTLNGSGSSDPDGDPLSYNWTGSFGAVSGVSPTVTLPLGTHTVTLVVGDGQATATDTVFITVQDTTAPETTITSAVNGNGAAVASGGATLSNSITFTFGGIDAVGVTGFQCRLDGATYAPCASPAGYLALAIGNHTFQVRALDTAGNMDSSPAGFTWVVVTSAQATQNLITAIGNLGLSAGIANSLSAPLSNINPNNKAAACGKLNAFINQVMAKTPPLTGAQATQLLQAANAIQASLGC